MKTIKELLDEVIDLEGKVQISQAIDFHKGVPPQRIIGKTMLLDYLRQIEFPFLQQAIMAMK